MLRKNIPNVITLANLACGFSAGIFALYDSLTIALTLILVAAVLDFFDGFAARLLKVSSPLGAQLDSLADLVTFGIAPGIIVFVWLDMATGYNLLSDRGFFTDQSQDFSDIFPRDALFLKYLRHIADSGAVNLKILLVALIMPVCGAIRLAKFNVSTDQTSEFKGLAIPAAGIFVASLPVVMEHFLMEGHTGLIKIMMNKYLVAGIVLAIGLLMVSNIPMFSFKVTAFCFKKYPFQIILIVSGILSIVAAVLLNNFWICIPIIVVLYIVLSLFKNLVRSNEI